MRDYDKCQLDPGVLPLVKYFNDVGLTTCMSCQGHNSTNMSMFWISFDKSIAENDIIEFQRQHTDKYGAFCCNGRFVLRILANTTGIGAGVEYSYQYMATTVEAANQDLERWLKMEEVLHNV